MEGQVHHALIYYFPYLCSGVLSFICTYIAKEEDYAFVYKITSVFFLLYFWYIVNVYVKCHSCLMRLADSGLNKQLF